MGWRDSGFFLTLWVVDNNSFLGSVHFRCPILLKKRGGAPHPIMSGESFSLLSPKKDRWVRFYIGVTMARSECRSSEFDGYIGIGEIPATELQVISLPNRRGGSGLSRELSSRYPFI